MLDHLVIPELPLKPAISGFIDALNVHLSWLFGALSAVVQYVDWGIRSALYGIPPVVLTAIVATFLILRRRYASGVLVLLGLVMVWNIGSWPGALDTVSLLILATAPALVLGLPIGILIAEVPFARAMLLPLLDLMQTVPAFVYLIPSVLFFGIGAVPGIVATMIFALPPFARAVALGLGEIPEQFVEVGRSVGLGEGKLLFKIKLPLATPYLLTGLSQTVMMSLSMVVTASLIGAPGVGTKVVASLSRMDFALGIEAGLCIVVLAITIDRVMEAAIAGRWIWRS